jgi:NIMA (never in mitosis gene a)-related kinase
MTDQYEIKREIGQGSFGKVSLVKKISDGMIYVWKEMQYGKMGEKEK